jgi:hypothetical protein
MPLTISTGQHHRKQNWTDATAWECFPRGRPLAVHYRRYTTRNWRPVPSGVYLPKALCTTFFGRVITSGANWGARVTMLATQCLSGVTDIDLQMSMHALGLAEWTHEFHSINPKYVVQLMHTREPGMLTACICPVCHASHYPAWRQSAVRAFRWMDRSVVIQEMATNAAWFYQIQKSSQHL